MSSYTIPTKEIKHTADELKFAKTRHREASRAMAKKDYASADAGFREGLSVVSDHAPSLAGLAICVAENGGRFLTAEKLAHKAATLDPQLPDGHLALCRINRLGNRPGRARRHLESARRLAPADSRLAVETLALRYERKPVISDLEAKHPLNRRLGQLRDMLMMRLKVSRKGVALEASA